MCRESSGNGLDFIIHYLRKVYICHVNKCQNQHSSESDDCPVEVLTKSTSHEDS